MVAYQNKLIYSVWKNYESFYVYAIDSLGNDIWSEILYSTRDQNASTDAVISDGNGGAIFAWYEIVPLRGIWVQQVNKDGQLGVVTSIKESSFQFLQPKDFQLLPAYPNPAENTIHIPYLISQNQQVTIKIYNVTGKEVRSFKIQNKNKGLHQIVWDGCDQNGNAVANGLYFYQLLISGQKQVSKLILLR